ATHHSDRSWPYHSSGLPVLSSRASLRPSAPPLVLLTFAAPPCRALLPENVSFIFVRSRVLGAVLLSARDWFRTLPRKEFRAWAVIRPISNRADRPSDGVLCDLGNESEFEMVRRSQAASHRHTRPPHGDHSHDSSHHQHHQPREPRFKREDVAPLYDHQINLADLDGLRPDIRVGIILKGNVSRLSKISAFLRRKYRDDDCFIEEDAAIIFYHSGDVLRDDRIPPGTTCLHYRVTQRGTDTKLRLLWNDHIEFHPPEVDELIDGIGNGATIRELRNDIAACLGVDDSARVVVSARDGLRRGLVQGNNWETRRVESWLCQTLFVDLVAEMNYIVMKGVNEEYIYHPFNCDRGVGSRTLKMWLHDRILTQVRHPKSLRESGPFDLDDISLSLGEKPLGKHSRVSLGSTIEFQLARRAHDQFVQEEAWLVPETETCVVCSDEKGVSEFPARITKTCSHQPTTCGDCIGQWIASSMDSVSWDRLKCPECSGLLAFEDVRAFADPETFQRYDSLAAKAALTSIREFRWCLNPRCGAGQIHKADCSKVKCHACKKSSCSRHDLPWHKGETCVAYDKRTRRQRKSDKASEKKVKEMTKSCPRCHKDVYKYTGCDHITCVCGHEWCYLCLAEYSHDLNSFLQCKHKRDCRYFQNPPIYEGGRVLRPFLRPPNLPPPPPPPWLGPRQRGPPMFGPLGFAPRPMAQRPLERPPTPTPPLPDQPQRIDEDPFNFMMRDFAGRGGQAHPLHGNHVNHGEAGFLGAAAMFDMGQVLQRAR
ncbi:hypothetical protein PG987_002824, partial [Apiospora arundinis]